MNYLPGKKNPCDYNSRNPVNLEEQDNTAEQMHSIQNEDTCVNKIVTDDLPDAVTLEMIQRATKNNETMQALIKKGYIDNNINLKVYKPILHEFTYTNGIILREHRIIIIISSTELFPGQSKLQQLVINLAHEGHQSEVKYRKLLRRKPWFPHMDTMIEQKVQKCLGCQATTYTLHPTEILCNQHFCQIDLGIN